MKGVAVIKMHPSHACDTLSLTVILKIVLIHGLYIRQHPCSFGLNFLFKSMYLFTMCMHLMNIRMSLHVCKSASCV